MKPLVTYPDVEREVVDLLTDLLDGEDVTVGVGVPDGWTPATGDHVQVACDGTPEIRHPVRAWPTVRITAWSSTTTEAKRLANLSLGLLCAHEGGAAIGSIKPLTGMLPARDPETRAELASVTVRVTVSTTPT